MSRYQSEAPEGQPTHTPKIIIRGVATGSPQYNALVATFIGPLRQFHVKHQQQVALSGERQYSAHQSGPDARMHYHNNQGQETLTLEVNPFIVEELSKEQPGKVFDLEFGGYLYFTIDRTPNQIIGGSGEDLGIPATFDFKLNDVSLFKYTFANTRDNAFWGVVLFGSSALKYHSIRDANNEVTQKFIDFPSPKYLDKNYLAGAFFFGDGDPMTLPYYDLFRVGGGVLGTHNMTQWDGVNTPLLLDGTAPNQNRFIGGGVVRYDELGASPLKPRDLNQLAVDITAPAGATLSGNIYGEFFSRSTRRVNKSWRHVAVGDQLIIMNDQPTYFFANFTNEVALIGTGGGELAYGQWYSAENSIRDMITNPPAAYPDPTGSIVTPDDPTSPVRQLILDLRK